MDVLRPEGWIVFVFFSAPSLFSMKMLRNLFLLFLLPYLILPTPELLRMTLLTRFFFLFFLVISFFVDPQWLPEIVLITRFLEAGTCPLGTFYSAILFGLPFDPRRMRFSVKPQYSPCSSTL